MLLLSQSLIGPTKRKKVRIVDFGRAMNRVKQMTILTVVLLILAVAMGFSTGWKITVITAAVVDLVMIVRRVWESHDK